MPFYLETEVSMKNFEFYTPTHIYFGKGYADQIGTLIVKYGYRKPLLVYGGGSIKQSGLYGRVIASLESAGLSHAEIGGVQPNPKLALAKEGIQICRAENCDIVLAVGGGSAIDTAKVIALGVPYSGDVWDFWSGKNTPVAALRTVCILTIAAAGSEMSQSAVITNEEGSIKRGINSEFNRPLFSIMDPELTYTLPKYQIACGIVDIMMHTIERYMTRKSEVELTDRIGEALLKTMVHYGPIAYHDPDNYEARAEIMWASSLSHNDLTGCGKDYFTINHKLGHELSAVYGTAHGASLSIILPAWMKYVYSYNIPRFAQFAVRVMGCEYDYANPENTALAGIRAVEAFFHSLDMPIRLSEIDVPEADIPMLAARVTANGANIFETYIQLSTKQIEDIFHLAY